MNIYRLFCCTPLLVALLALAPTPASQSKDTGPKLLKNITCHEGGITSIAFSPNGKMLATSGAEKGIKLWNLGTGEAMGTLAEDTHVGSPVFSPDGDVLACTGGAVFLWNVKDKSLIDRLRVDRDTIRTVKFSPDGRMVAAGVEGSKSNFSGACIWGRASGAIRTLLDHRVRGPEPLSISFSPDSKSIATGSGLLVNSIKFWDIASGKNTGTIEKAAKYGVVCIAFSPDGKLLASSGRNTGGKEPELESTNSHRQQPLAGGDGEVKLWDAATFKNVAILQGHLRTVPSIAFSPDGKLLASGSHDRTIRLWDTATHKCLHVLDPQSTVAAVAFSPDGKLLISGNGDGTVKIWELQPGK